MLHDSTCEVDSDLEKLRPIIARHWRRFGWSIWSESDLDLAMERARELAEYDPQAIREILNTGIVGRPSNGKR